jgi:hypothetical protein
MKWPLVSPGFARRFGVGESWPSPGLPESRQEKRPQQGGKLGPLQIGVAPRRRGTRIFQESQSKAVPSRANVLPRGNGDGPSKRPRALTGSRPGRQPGVSVMSNIPLDFQRRFEQRWAARFPSAAPQKQRLESHRQRAAASKEKKKNPPARTGGSLGERTAPRHDPPARLERGPRFPKKHVGYARSYFPKGTKPG